MKPYTLAAKIADAVVWVVVFTILLAAFSVATMFDAAMSEAMAHPISDAIDAMAGWKVAGITVLGPVAVIFVIVVVVGLARVAVKYAYAKNPWK